MSSAFFPVLVSMAAPFALMLPLLGYGTAAQGEDAGSEPVSDSSRPASSAPPSDAPVQGPFSSGHAPRTALDAFYAGQVTMQVRIEQRVVVRIPSRRVSTRQSMMAQLPQRTLSRRYEERQMDRCVPISRIAAVQTDTANRLLLFLRNDEIVSVNLDRNCRARDFYSGFYIEQNEDQQMCVQRDELQSRTGARCEIDRMRLLVPIED